jgi:predicted metalloendopeptidase
MIRSRLIKAVACILVCLPFAISCDKWGSESTVDPLPFPMDANKDLSVDPGDDFFRYCNGAWQDKTPTPEKETVGGLYSMTPIMKQLVQETVDSDPSLKRYFLLLEEMYGHKEASEAYLAGLMAKYPVPETSEGFFRGIGQLITEGALPIDLTLANDWKDGKIIGLLSVNNSTYKYSYQELDPSVKTEVGWIAEGMGMDPATLYYNDYTITYLNILKNIPTNQYANFWNAGWTAFSPFVSEEGLAQYNAAKKSNWTVETATTMAQGCIGYELSCRLAEKYVTPQLKEHFIDLIERLREVFRIRINNLDWMSETTRVNALEKLDKMMVFAGSPDKWFDDCLPDLSKCESLAEAVSILKHSEFLLKKNLIGTRDVLSGTLTQVVMMSDGKPGTSDLSLVNARYVREYNCILIYPAMMLPPAVDPAVSEARQWAALTVEGHEITHGFDSEGAKYDALGRVRNWWTVADQLAFKERQEMLIQCFNSLEYDPVAYPGVFSDGKRTLTENIADLGGFLIARDAYIVHLQEEGYSGEEFVKQLKKFHEAYADLYNMKYSPDKLSVIMSSDIHSHCRLRVNGIVMNTDLWYNLYDVTRNNILYLPPERRTYIW